MNAIFDVLAQLAIGGVVTIAIAIGLVIAWAVIWMWSHS